MHGLILIIALCLDSFMACFAYGSNKVKIPFLSALLVAFIGSLFLGISVYTAVYIRNYIPIEVATMISFSIFLMIGLSSLFQSSIKAYLKKYSNQKKLSFRYQNVAFVLDIYIDEMNADQDHSKKLSLLEAFYLSMALSLDSIVSGFALGVDVSNPFVLLILSFILGFLAIYGGYYLGKKLNRRKGRDFSWISGLMFIGLAILRII